MSLKSIYFWCCNLLTVPLHLLFDLAWFCQILGERKKSVRLNTEFNRSVSVPAERAQNRIPGHSSAPNQTPTTPDPE